MRTAPAHHLPPIPCLEQRLHEHQGSPDAGGVDADERERCYQADSDPSPVSTGSLGSRRPTIDERIAAFDDSAIHSLPLPPMTGLVLIP